MNTLRAQLAPSRGESEPSATIDPLHREDLEELLDLLRATIELESRCDFAEPESGSALDRAVFLAHFGELDVSLLAWNERVERVRAAPGALWESLARAATRRGLVEPPFSVGPLVDRMAVITVERSRRGQLGVPHELSIERFRDKVGGSPFVSLYMEGQRVASLPPDPEGDADAAALTAERLIQACFDEAQHSEAALEIDNARDALLDLKQHLLGMLAEHAAADTIGPSADCPLCGAPVPQL